MDDLVYVGTYTDPAPLRRAPASPAAPVMGMTGPTGSAGIYALGVLPFLAAAMMWFTYRMRNKADELLD